MKLKFEFCIKCIKNSNKNRTTTIPSTETEQTYQAEAKMEDFFVNNDPLGAL